jgi:hypothetical protein
LTSYGSLIAGLIAIRQQDDASLAGLANRKDRSYSADVRVAQHALMQVEIVGNCEHRKVATQEVQELVFLTERQPAQLTVYPETGHSPNWERPERVAADLEGFVGSAQ